MFWLLLENPPSGRFLYTVHSKIWTKGEHDSESRYRRYMYVYERRGKEAPLRKRLVGIPVHYFTAYDIKGCTHKRYPISRFKYKINVYMWSPFLMREIMFRPPHQNNPQVNVEHMHLYFTKKVGTIPIFATLYNMNFAPIICKKFCCRKNTSVWNWVILAHI